MIPIQHLNKRLLDLKASKVDKEKSKCPEYVFKGEKTYYSKKAKPTHILKWCTKPRPNESGVPLMESWKYLYGFTNVLAQDFDYWVEGLTPDANGWCVHGDAVLMKIPIGQYADKIRGERDDSKNQVRASVSSFRGRAKKAGAELKDDLISDILGVASKPDA